MFVVGTAGHIDHGKSALVTRMTGIDPDRLPEEKKRGMTIDLGFAWVVLPSGREIGIVDVPGHERFVKNMVAGVGGIDAVIFVVAADDGWMPQSEEHFQITRLLGVKTGLVALTKKDLVDDDLLKLQIDDIKARLEGSFLDNCPIVPVSSVTGDGADDVLNELDGILTEEIQRPDIGAARLFIDRKFAIQGMGTVVTGTLLEGKLSLDDEVEIQPSGKLARLRNLQTHKKMVNEAHPGSRVALNLAGVEKEDIKRGQAVCSTGTVVPSAHLAVQLTVLSGSQFPLKNGSEVWFILGTADLLGRIRLLENDILKPGHEGLAIIRLREPVPAKIGDRFIIRRTSPQDTIGGGVVLDTETLPDRKRKGNRLEILRMRSSLTPAGVICSEMSKGYKRPLSKIYQNTPFERGAIESALDKLRRDGEIVVSGDYMLSGKFLQRLLVPALELIEKDHRLRPWVEGLEPGALGKRLGLEPGTVPAVVEYLVSTGKVLMEKGCLKLAGHKPELKPEQRELGSRLSARLSASPLAAPTKKDFVEEDPRYEVVINFLKDRGEILELKGGILLTSADFEKLSSNIQEYLKRVGQATASDLKNYLRTTRKYVIPLLEKLDRDGVTVRRGDYRILAKR